MVRGLDDFKEPAVRLIILHILFWGTLHQNPKQCHGQRSYGLAAGVIPTVGPVVPGFPLCR